MKPNVIILYRCPKCEGYMEGHTRNIWNKRYEEWQCVKCRKLFKLDFKELRK